MNNDHLISNVFNILFTVHPAIARCILWTTGNVIK
jgi:hypothetical protein